MKTIRNGRFYGPRVGCENAPRLPARVVRWALDDPRQTSYVLLWYQDEEHGIGGAPELVESITVQRDDSQPFEGGESVELRRRSNDYSRDWCARVAVLRRTTPAGGSDLFLVCPKCVRPKRYLYAWERSGWGIAKSPWWPCRGCAGLRFRSEGRGSPSGYLGRFLGLTGRLPWPWDPWEPYVFSSPKRAAEALAG
jgi:hypothetical protein